MYIHIVCVRYFELVLGAALVQTQKKTYEKSMGTVGTLYRNEFG